MKAIKLIFVYTMGCFLSLTLSSNTPEKGAEKMVNRMERDITLTSEQKEAILSKAILFIHNMKAVNDSLEVTERLLLKYEFAQQYEFALDSILTVSQRDELKRKESERREAIIKSHLTDK